MEPKVETQTGSTDKLMWVSRVMAFIPGCVANNGNTHGTGTPVNTPSTSPTFSGIFLLSPLAETQSKTIEKKLFFFRNN